MTKLTDVQLALLRAMAKRHVILGYTDKEKNDAIAAAVVEIELLRADLRLREHQNDCWACDVGGVPCDECDSLEAALNAAEAAGAKP
jgi:hypothetical protein